MKVLFFSFLIAIASAEKSAVVCTTKILQNYGVEGITLSVSYKSILPTMQNDYCPSIQDSCCTRDDFEKTNKIWLQKVENIKKYVTKIFKIYRNLAMIQSALLNVYDSIPEQKKKSKTCSKIDATFFNSVIQQDEVYQYLESALQTFVFLQKGFYCTICDAKTHKFFEEDRTFSRKVLMISKEMCSDMIFFFKEFIFNKVSFIDPFIETLGHLNSCLGEDEPKPRAFETNVNYQTVMSCLKENKHCDFICKEFRFGTSSDLFIGQTEKYFEMYERTRKLLANYGKDAISIDFVIEEDNYNKDFFGLDSVRGEEYYTILKDYDLRSYTVEVAEDGLDLFNSAMDAKYFVTDQMTVSEMKNNFGINEEAGFGAKHPLIDAPESGILPGQQILNSMEVSKKMEIDASKEADLTKLRRMKETGELPTNAEMENLQVDMVSYERKYMQNLREGIIDVEGTGIESNEFSYFQALKIVEQGR